MKKILIAGGAGFIGSTIASKFSDAGIEPIILDDLSTGRKEFVRNRKFYQGNIADGEVVDKIFAENPEIELAILCAAFIIVPDSMEKPLEYYHNNVGNAVNFLLNISKNGCNNLIFSSSGSIYDSPADFIVTENSPIKPQSPYANTKAVFENILENLGKVNKFNIVSLRYFNPIGADPQLRTGLQIEFPSHALGKIIISDRNGEEFTVTGTNWPTRDGSGIRDYIHVWDLAEAHLLTALKFNELTSENHFMAINLGTGTGTTVFELIKVYENVTKHQLKITEASPRLGDVAGAYADNSKAKRLLNWEPKFSLEEGISDTLNWFETRKNILTFIKN